MGLDVNNIQNTQKPHTVQYGNCITLLVDLTTLKAQTNSLQVQAGMISGSRISFQLATFFFVVNVKCLHVTIDRAVNFV